MKKILVAALLLGLASLASAQVQDFSCPDGSCSFFKDSHGRTIVGFGVRPTADQTWGLTMGTPFYDGPTYQWYWWTGATWTSTFAAPTLTGTVTLTGKVIVPDGTAAAPSIQLGTTSPPGLYRSGNFALAVASGGNAMWRIDGSSGYSSIPSNYTYAWSSTTAATGSPDLFLSRDAAATLQLGVDAASGTAQTLKAPDSSTSGNAGANLTLSGGNGGGTVGAPKGDVLIGSGSLLIADSHAVNMVADAAMPYGSAVMVDAGTANRFDAASGGGTVAFGFVAGSAGATVQASTYPVIVAGLAYCYPVEDQAYTLAHYAIVGAGAGQCTDSAAISTIGKNFGYILESSPVSNVILPAGCTGGTGCINTALNTPNVGPAGQITLSADVAAQGWAVGDPVIYHDSGGVAPTGMTDGAVYFLVSVATTNVTIAATKGGAVVVPTTQGTDATQYLQKLPHIAVSFR